MNSKVLFNFLLTLVAQNCDNCDGKVSIPNITATAVFYDGEWRTDIFDNAPRASYHGIGFPIPGEIEGLHMKCEAPYPIQWSFFNQRWRYEDMHPAKGIQFVNNKRIVRDFYNTSTYTYLSELTIQSQDNKMTGNYTCHSTTNSKLVSFIYLFWEGNSPPYFLNYGETITLYFTQMPFVIPCRVSIPNANVTLLKVYEVTDGNATLKITERVNSNNRYDSSDDPFGFQHNTVTRMTGNRYLSYHPAVGFRFAKATGRVDSYIAGNYRCVIENGADERDVVDYKVVIGADPETPYKESISGNATFVYDFTRHQFTCCSTNSKAPSMVMLFCDHPSICAIKKPLLLQMVNSGKRHGRGGCTKLDVRFQSSGIIKCSGAGVEVYREFFFPFQIDWRKIRWGGNINWRNFSVTGKPYYDWNEAIGSDMIEVSTSKLSLYAGDTAMFVCSTSTYYFAEGIVWILRYADNSTVVQKVTAAGKVPRVEFGFRPTRKGYSNVNVSLRKDLVAVSCFAPVWNSTEWAEKRLPVSIKKPTAPTFEESSSAQSSTSVDVTWNLSDKDKILMCNVTGDPKPSISWKLDNRPISSSQIMNRTRLVVKAVTQKSGGVYSCIARNFVGNVTKTFHVHVSVPEKGNSMAVVAEVGCSLLLVVVVIGIAGGLYRMHTRGKLSGFIGRFSIKSTFSGPDSVNITPTPATSARLPSLRDLMGGANGNGEIVQEFSNPLSTQPAGTNYNRF